MRAIILRHLRTAFSPRPLVVGQIGDLVHCVLGGCGAYKATRETCSAGIESKVPSFAHLTTPQKVDDIIMSDNHGPAVDISIFLYKVHHVRAELVDPTTAREWSSGTGWRPSQCLPCNFFFFLINFLEFPADNRPSEYRQNSNLEPHLVFELVSSPGRLGGASPSRSAPLSQRL
jgi:hypothetical protein